MGAARELAAAVSAPLVVAVETPRRASVAAAIGVQRLSRQRSRWHRSPRAWLAATLFVFAFAVGVVGNGAERPLDAHEAFVARTALEMQRRGDLCVPYFDGAVRLQKPPLNYWLALLAAKLRADPAERALSESSVRLPSAVCGGVCVVATAGLGWLLFESTVVSVLGALLFATSGLYVEWSRSAQPEMTYACCCALMQVGVAWASRRASERRSTWLPALVLWSAAAAAILAKGPILPALIVCASACALRRGAGGPGFARTLHAATGALVLLGVVGPYVALVLARVPDAAEVWRSQMFDRFGAPRDAWWRPFELYYVGQALENSLPWCALLIALPFVAWRRRARASRTQRAHACHAHDERRLRMRVAAWCVLLPCAVLSCAAGRKGYYLLPLTPLVCLWMAWAGVELAASASRFTLLVRAHAIAFCVRALMLLAELHTRGVELELAPRSWIAPCAWLVLAAALALASLRDASRAPRRGALAVLASACATALAIGSASLDANVSRATGGEFARAVARVVDATRPLLVLDGDSQVLLHYTDHDVAALRVEDVRRAIEATPTPWIVDRAARWEERGLGGRIVLRERACGRSDPYALIDPSREPAPRE